MSTRGKEATIVAPGQCQHEAPELEGIVCEVQHSVGQGEFTTELGSFGFGVIILPTGQPRVVCQIKHADGTSLGATLKTSVDAATALECLMAAMEEAQRIAEEAAAAKRRAS